MLLRMTYKFYSRQYNVCNVCSKSQIRVFPAVDESRHSTLLCEQLDHVVQLPTTGTVKSPLKSLMTGEAIRCPQGPTESNLYLLLPLSGDVVFEVLWFTPIYFKSSYKILVMFCDENYTGGA